MSDHHSPSPPSSDVPNDDDSALSHTLSCSLQLSPVRRPRSDSALRQAQMAKLNVCLDKTRARKEEMLEDLEKFGVVMPAKSGYWKKMGHVRRHSVI